MGITIEKLNQFAAKGKENKILPHLKSKDKQIRIGAIKALGNCTGGEEGFNQLTTMMPMTTDKDELIAICDALGNLGKEQSFYHISHYMDQVNDPDVIDAMRKAIAKIRQHHT